MRSLSTSLYKAVIIIALLFLFPVVQGGAVEYDDVTVTVEAPPGSEFNHGYVEYRATVENRSSSRAHEVTLSLPGTSYGNDELQVSRKVTVNANSTLRVNLFQPCYSQINEGMAVEIDGYRRSETVRLNVLRPRYSSGPWTSVLISRSMREDDFELEDKETKTYDKKFGLMRAEVPIAEWSSNWLGYSRFDAVVVTASDFRSAPVPVKTALWQYVECGGVLVHLGGRIEVPETWKGNSRQEDGMMINPAGFGLCFSADNSSPQQFFQSTNHTLMEAIQNSNFPFEQRKDIEAANNAFKVVEGFEVPVRGLFVLMLAFAVLIGPVNIIVLSQRKKRIWILWTVPLFSFLTCVAVFLYASFAEGWGAHARYEGVTLLDEKNHRATTLGWSAFYASLTPGNGAHFEQGTDLTIQMSGRGYRSSGGRSVKVDWSSDQHLLYGWIVSRVPSHFMIRKSETRRERLAVQFRPDGSVAMVNGLGAPIKKVYVCKPDGQILRGESLAVGKEAVLTAEFSKGVSSRGAWEFRPLFVSDWLGNVSKMGNDPGSYLTPGSYLALLDGSPFFDRGLESLATQKGESIVLGFVKQDGNEN